MKAALLALALLGATCAMPIQAASGAPAGPYIQVQASWTLPNGSAYTCDLGSVQHLDIQYAGTSSSIYDDGGSSGSRNPQGTLTLVETLPNLTAWGTVNQELGKGVTVSFLIKFTTPTPGGGTPQTATITLSNVTDPVLPAKPLSLVLAGHPVIVQASFASMTESGSAAYRF